MGKRRALSLLRHIAIASDTASGLAPGVWFDRLLFLEGLDHASAAADERLICHDASGAPWTSRYLRSTYLWPLLQEQRLHVRATNWGRGRVAP